MNQDTTASGKPRKRSAVACNPCRSKRIKCDGSRPSCRTCCEADEQCEYSSKEGNRKPPSKRYVEALQERVKYLELQLQQLSQDVSPAANPSQLPEELQEPSLSGHDSESCGSSTPSNRRSPIRELTDRLGRLNVGEDGQVHYFGSRSNFSLLRKPFLETSSVSMGELQKRKMDTLHQLNLYVEVSDEVRDELLAIFWSWQNSWQYIVVKHLFLKDLLVDHSGRYASPLVLSAVLALAARYSDRPELRTDPGDPNTAGNALAEQAKMLLFYESQAPSVTTVQGAALLSLRETATDKEALGWVYCGMATRMAFNLGLHLDCNQWRQAGYITEEEVELRNVVWWGIYVLDKLFNIGLGRPSAIQEHEVTAPLPAVLPDDEYAIWTGVLATGTSVSLPASHIISNCRGACQLFKIAAPVLDEVYRPRSGLNKSRIVDLITKTHVALMDFYTHLPSCLRLPASYNQPALPQVYNLHLQYHVAVILLHRPFIAVSKDAVGSATMAVGEAVLSHLNECIQSARSIVNIFKAYRKHYSLRRIPISAVHCAFTASIICLVETTAQGQTDRRRSLAHLECLVAALDEMSTAWAWSRRALCALRQLATEWSVAEDAQNILNVGRPALSKLLLEAQPTSKSPNTDPFWGPDAFPCFSTDLVGIDQAGTWSLWDELDNQAFWAPMDVVTGEQNSCRESIFDSHF